MKSSISIYIFIYNVFIDAVTISNQIASNCWMIVDTEGKIIWKGAVIL
jgi:hypothetical protein